MWRFSEAFMEACLAECPSAFLGGHLELIDQQPLIGGFRPDLLLADEQGRFVILEVQKNALDRYHLYKTLEYRDLVSEKFDKRVSEVILVCESIEDRYRKIAATHNVSVRCIDRKEFLQIAIKRCPNTLLDRLSSLEEEVSMRKTNQEEFRKYEFQPLGWHDSLSSHQILAYLESELARMGTSIDKVGRPYQKSVYYSLYDFPRDGSLSVLKEIYRPEFWNMQALQSRSNKKSFDQNTIIPTKPVLHLFARVTIKDNLSVTWRPACGYGDTSDWAYWPGDGTEGWSRPRNELMYVRDVGNIYLGRYSENELDDRANSDVLNEILIAGVRAAYNELKQALSIICDVHIHDDFLFDLDEEKSGFAYGSGRIKKWSIYNVDARKHELEITWLHGFKKEYGISVEKFTEFYNSVAEDIGSNAYRFNEVFSRKLQKQKIKITPSEIGRIASRFKDHHPNIAAKMSSIKS